MVFLGTDNEVHDQLPNPREATFKKLILKTGRGWGEAAVLCCI
jgi:hypothetical protein